MNKLKIIELQLKKPSHIHVDEATLKPFHNVKIQI